MVLFRQSQSGKHVDAEWHEVRALARLTTNSTDEWSDEDIIRYDLDTARITGKENIQNWLINRDIDNLGQNGTDIRTLDDR